MLDFYVIEEHQTTPKSPKGLAFVKGLESDIVGRLKQKNIIPNQYDYYSDFRWSLEIIERLILKLDENTTDTDQLILYDLLFKATSQKMGLIAFCD